MTDRVYTNLTITSGNLITKNIQCSAGLTCGNINASDVTIGNLTVTGFTTTVNVTEQNVVDTNITTGSLNATGITAGNINFTGSLYQNGVAYSSSQWTTTSGNVSYTSGSIVGTSVSATNMISTSQTTGTLVASSGITAGNINFTGSLYQNGALYSPSASPVYGIYNVTGGGNAVSGTTNLAPYFSTSTVMNGLSKSNTGWTNTSGSTMILQVNFNLRVFCNSGSSFGLYISLNGNSTVFYGNVFSYTGNGNENVLSTIMTLNNNEYFTIYSSGSGIIYGPGGGYNYTSRLSVNILH